MFTEGAEGGAAMSESSVRSGRKKGYVVLFREVAQDDRLSLEARGLFALIVSLPDDWEYTVSGLAVKAGCGQPMVLNDAVWVPNLTSLGIPEKWARDYYNMGCTEIMIQG